MKKTIFLIAISLLAYNSSSAQIMLADSAWQTTSTHHTMMVEMELVEQYQTVTISHENQLFTFDYKKGKKSDFTVLVAYDKTELGIVFFIPKSETITRLTIQKEAKLIVVEYADDSMKSFEYDMINYTTSKK